MTELEIPPAALEDKNSFEILRVWAASEEQHVTIHSNLNGDATDFGFMLANLAAHGARLYSQRTGIDEAKALNQILDGFVKEVSEQTGDSTGEIPGR